MIWIKPIRRFRGSHFAAFVMILGILTLNGTMLSAQAETPTPRGYISITGQLVPGVNSDPDAGANRIYWDLNSDQLPKPVKYYLYDLQNLEYSLTFSEVSLKRLSDNFLRSRSAQGYAISELWNKNIELAAYTALWQHWAGLWVTISGY